MILLESIISFLRDPNYRNLLFTTLVILGIGTVMYHFLEGWSWLDSFYFSVITLTTIGYGDFSPQTSAGKIFTLFYILIGIGIILSFVSTVFEHYKEQRSNSKTKAKKTK
jgi:voltage-gated potassium channel Kch